MKISIYRLTFLWIVLSIIDTAFAVDGNMAWDSFFFLKDYVPLSIIFIQTYRYFNGNYFMSKSDKNMFPTIALTLTIRSITEIFIISNLIEITSIFLIVLYMLLLCVIFLIKDYE